MRTLRVIAIFSIAAAAACVSSVEHRAAPDTTAQAAHESISALHAAIPVSQTAGNVFEYATVLDTPAPEKVAVFAGADGKYFDYY